uniref:FYVE-type domain-containing protein n=1 Tax=Hyaloperonospora arabidopsidis (strain Emoy2) TaxID=559515 RepID=M4B5Z8_HYAAE
MGKARTLSRRRAASTAPGTVVTPAPSLTPNERAYMIRKAKEASVALVEHAHTLDGPVQWHYTGKFRGIQMYRGEGSYDHGGGSSSGTEFLCGVTTMMGSIEEVANYFNQQTTEQMRAKKAEDVLDCGVLYLLVRGDPKNPFYRVSAKYQLYEGPSAFSRERDYCFLECQNTFRHASGRRGWVLSMHSIKLPSCPEVDGVVRGSMYQSGYVFVEAEKKGYMDVMHSLQINFKSTNRLPHFLLNSALRRRILSVVTVSREIQTTRMGRQTLLKKKQLMPKHSRVLCVNCARKFSLFVRKTRCRVCGEVVCQPCAPQVTLTTKCGVVKTRVCTKCYHLSPTDDYGEEDALRDGGEDLRRMENETRYSDILQDHQDHPDKYRDDNKDYDDSLDDDEDEDGLEEQSDYSVFAQSRFTDASRDSAGTSQFGASKFDSHFKGSSQFGATNELDDSQFNGGNTSVDSSVSGTSTSDWTGGNSAVSSVMDWKQASSTRPADGYIYDPQASITSNNFYGASSGGSSDYEASYRTHKGKPDKRAGRYKAAVPIPENEAHSHRGGSATSYNSSTKSKSMRRSNNGAKQATMYDVSCDSHALNESQTGKTLSIQSLAKSRAARYGIKSQFPPPPPPPHRNLPLDEREREVGDSPLYLGALKSDKIHSSKDRKVHGIAARKSIAPPSPKEGRRETDRLCARRAPKIPRGVTSNAVVASRGSQASRASSRGSKGHGSNRSSAIVEKVRRNRDRATRYNSDINLSSSELKTMEKEHLARMCEIERMQELSPEKAARRLTAPDWSRLSVPLAQSGDRCHSNRSSAAVAGRKQKQPLRGSHRYSSHTTSNSPIQLPYASPPGTPPSVRSRRVPKNVFVNSRTSGSFGGNRSRQTDNSSNFEASRILSDRSNNTFAKSDHARVSLAPSARSEDLVFNTQRSGLRVSKGSDSSFSDRRVDGSQGSSDISYRDRRSDTSSVSTISDIRHPGGFSLDTSQVSNDAKFSSSIAILEPTVKSSDRIAMMESFSAERHSLDSLLDEDLLNQSLAGMTEHIYSMRARAAYKLPDEERCLSDDLQRLQEEHRKRMEELTKMADNHIIADIVRDSTFTFGGLHDSTSSLGGLHDSSVSLTDYSENYFGGSTMSSASSTSSVDIDDETFDFGSRPFGRSKRSGTIAFALEEMGSVEDDDGESDDPETSYYSGQEHGEQDYRSEGESGYHSSEKFDVRTEENTLSTRRDSEELDTNNHEDEGESIDMSHHSSRKFEEHKTRQESGFTTPPRRISAESGERGYEQVNSLATPLRCSTANSVESVSERLSDPAFRPSGGVDEQSSGVITPSHSSRVESIESTHDPNAGLCTPPRRSSVASAESMDENTNSLAALPRRSSVDSGGQSGHEQKSSSAIQPHHHSVESLENGSERTDDFADSSLRCSSADSVKSEHEQSTGIATPPRRLSVESVESEQEQSTGIATPPRRLSVEPVESEQEQSTGIATPPRRLSVESVESEHEQSTGTATPPRRLSVESVESEHVQSTGTATPPRRLSVESVESEHEQSTGTATPPRRLSVESVESEQEQSTDIATPPRRLSVESAESEYEQSTGIATPPRRLSVESVESEHEQSTGITTPLRRLSVESVESEFEQSTGLATLPHLPRSEFVEHEHVQSTGIATPPRRLSVESVQSEHEENTGIATPPRRASAMSVEHDHDYTSGLATPQRRQSTEPVGSEHECASDLVTSRRQSAQSAESEYGRDNRSDDAGSSRSSSEENDKDLDETVTRESDHEDARPVYQSSEEPLNQQGDLEYIESAYRSSNGSIPEHASTTPKRMSEESVAFERRDSKFDPDSSQLILSSVVDEFSADIPNVLSDSDDSEDENNQEDTHSPRTTPSVCSEQPQLVSTVENGDGDHVKLSLFETLISNGTCSPDVPEHVLSSFRESCVSVIDEELMNRPTIELFDVVRANRSAHNMDGNRSPDTMSSLEASHLRRMEELNQIAVDHLGNRISDLDEDLLGSAFRPGRSLHPGFRDEDREMQWRSSDVMEQVHNKHEIDMEKLRRRIRRLEEECRESIASVLTAEEMDLSEFDDDDGAFNGLQSFHGHQSFSVGRSFSHQASFTSGKSSTISEDGDMDTLIETDEPLPARVLFEQIAQLTRLQQEMTEAENDEDEEESRARIKEQYRVLRAIKANRRHDSGSLSEDDENWI